MIGNTDILLVAAVLLSCFGILPGLPCLIARNVTTRSNKIYERTYVDGIPKKQPNKQDLISSQTPLLLLSTLDGALVGVNKNTGEILWTLQEDPILDVPVHSAYDLRFLPNPKDGSLYAFSNGDQLERLPLTIPELVHVSPTMSSDGLLYTARKSDLWLAVDPWTGTKLHTFSSDGITSATCPVGDSEERAVMIARTAYTVTVFDGHSKEKRWNATYVEYMSHSFADHSPNDLLHFCSSSDGAVLSVDALTGQQVWRHSFGSPVIAIYSLDTGSLRKVPITTVASNTMDYLTGSSVLALRADTLSIKATDTILQSSLFVGSHHKQVYALDSLANEEEVKMEFNPIQSSVPLLEGPGEGPREETVTSGGTGIRVSELGYFCTPSQSHAQFTPLSRQIQQEFMSLLQYGSSKPSTASHVVVETPSVGIIGYEDQSMRNSPHVYVTSPADSTSDSSSAEYTLGGIVLPIITIAVSSTMAAMIALLVSRLSGHKQQANFQLIMNEPSSTSSPSASLGRASASDSVSHSSHSSVHSSETKGIVNASDNNQNGIVQIGKIAYASQDILGHGSEGTMVFKGTFDKRQVAVKRILPECFDLADREVELLRQSDQHPNVVRYFCMEQDSLFRYIALELCQATLREYVEDWRFDRSIADPVSILHQSMKGLAYLHSIGIVHRDIKPQNVLLSQSSSNRPVRALISDFGLCRKLPYGKGSFTAKSGIMGTEGWIAPEVLQGTARVTCAVDVFSMGCVIYYVLTGGHHPFGPSLRRQANIETGDAVLTALSGNDKYVALELIKDMISTNYLFRPKSVEVLSHCLFWSKEKILAFFQDVSDRVEKELPTSPISQALEQGALHVVKGDWKRNISDELREDLRKFRSYQGTSVKDLLRALRNKKHHYRELPEPVKQSFGNIPDGFVDYFTTRFPLLLIHIYKRMECCKHEKIFVTYYTCEH